MTKVEKSPNEGEDADFASLDFVYDEAQRIVKIQLGLIDSRDTKAGLSLGAAGLILSVLISGQAGPAIQGRIDLPQSLFLFLSGLLMITTLGFALKALWVRPYKVAPHPRTMRLEYLTMPATQTKLQVLDNLVGNLESNDRVLAAKVRALQWGARVFVVGLVALGLVFLYTIVVASLIFQ